MNEWRFYWRWIRCSRDWLYFFLSFFFFLQLWVFIWRKEVFCFRWASNKFQISSARVRSTKTFRVRLNLWEDSLKKNPLTSLFLSLSHLTSRSNKNTHTYPVPMSHRSSSPSFQNSTTTWYFQQRRPVPVQPRSPQSFSLVKFRFPNIKWTLFPTKSHKCNNTTVLYHGMWRMRGWTMTILHI